MKKQILLMSLCLAFSATSVIAAEKGCPISSKTQTAVTEKVSAPIEAKTQTPEFVKNAVSPVSIDKQKIKKSIDEKHAQRRNMLYSTLKLTEEQKAKAIEIDNKTKNELRPLMKQLHQESKKLYVMKTNKEGICKIWKQRAVVNSLKAKFKTQMVSHRTKFEAILTDEQKVKYRLIENERRAQMHEFRKHHKKGEFGKKPLMAPPPEEIGRGCPIGPNPMGPPPPPPVK